MQSGRSFAGPFIALFTAMAVGWLMQPADSPPMRLPTRPAPSPDWELVGLDGRPARLTDYKGRIVVMNLWATYCIPCVRETPDLIRFHEAQATNGVVVVGVAAEDGARETVPPFVKAHRIPYPVYYADLTAIEQFGSVSLPQTFVIDRDGMIQSRFIGRMRLLDLEKAIAPLLAGNLTNRPPDTGSGVR
jgi:thiol-disulfide isomerase/thioredoxin